MNHEPVLLSETIAELDLRPGLIVLDATLGDGGHSRVIGETIGSEGRLIALDADPAAIEQAKKTMMDLPCKLDLIVGNFRELARHLKILGVDRIDRALFDLGLASPQLADPTRGFSFQTEGPLLMTLAGGDTVGWNAARLVNELALPQIADILTRYGEESYARQIAEAIVLARRNAPILTTSRLVEIIATAVPKGYRFARKHFATKTFQALRIAVNDELEALTMGLEAAWSLLAVSGRVAVISFHSLEARLVKTYFRTLVETDQGELITKHAVRPTREEVIRNPRSRSATLRIISKINQL